MGMDYGAAAIWCAISRGAFSGWKEVPDDAAAFSKSPPARYSGERGNFHFRHAWRREPPCKPKVKGKRLKENKGKSVPRDSKTEVVSLIRRTDVETGGNTTAVAIVVP